MEETRTNKSGTGEQRQNLANASNEKTVLPVIEEHVVITKEIVETGKVFIRKRVMEEEVSINIPLTQEGYKIERLPGKKELLTQHPPIRYEGDNMVIPVVREVIITEKRYEVMEEIHVIKTKTNIPHLQQITLLKEEVQVERKSSNS